MADVRRSKYWPRNIHDAIRILDDVISEKDKDLIRSIPLSESSLHSTLRVVIQNEFGLLSGNDELITATLEVDAYLASMTIIREFWDHLHRPKASLSH